MLNDLQSFEGKLKRLTDAFFTGRRQQIFWFWVVGIGIVIPTLTYISSTLIGLLAGLALNLLGISSEAFLKAVALFIIIVCALSSLVIYYKLWILYKSKPGKTKTEKST